MISDSASRSGEGKKKVLFLCTHNSARSQMAEGLLRAMYGDRYEAYSAGVEATAVDPRAVRAMSEIGIDISGQRSKSAQEFLDTVFDLAVTVCDRARQACPICSTDIELPARTPRCKRGHPQKLRGSGGDKRIGGRGDAGLQKSER